MAFAKLECPDCGKVFRPAKPVPEGKRVKCPECGAGFVVGEDEPDEPVKKKKKDEQGAIKKGNKAAAVPQKSAKKEVPGKKPEKKAPVPQQPAAGGGEDDDGPMTYGFSKDEDDDDDKPEINYAPDTSIKDPRGPAQGIVMVPSNYMLMSGIVGFLGWIAVLIIILIPKVFPLTTDEPTGGKEKPAPMEKIDQGLGAVALDSDPPVSPKIKEKEEEAKKPSMLEIGGVNLGLLAMYSALIFILILSPIWLGMLWAGLIAYSAVKIQSLESRVWGIVGCILTMIPYGFFGVIVLVCLLVGILGNMVFDDRSTVAYLQWGVLAMFVLAEVATGAWTLVTLMKPEVVEGFEFEPE
jgi:hypothetical protein